jgi:hypothetical protein
LSNQIQPGSEPRRRDRTTLPCIALLIACLLIVLGHSSNDAALAWILSGILVGASFLWVFRPQRGERSEKAG